MDTMQGIIERVNRQGSGFTLTDDPEVWYNAFHASQLQGAQAGDEVEFQVEYVTKGGKDFNNIKGDVSFVGEEQPKPARRAAPARGGRGAPARGAAPARGGRAASAAPARQSAAPADDPRQRSIVRQNALTQANSVYATLSRAGLLGDLSPEQLVDEVLEAAKKFETYAMLED